jgi:hypothetical protein
MLSEQSTLSAAYTHTYYNSKFGVYFLFVLDWKAAPNVIYFVTFVMYWHSYQHLNVHISE